jgi:hypothetical protein
MPLSIGVRRRLDKAAQDGLVAFQGPVGPDQGDQGASDRDHVAVVPGLGHLGQRGQRLFPFARHQGVFDQGQLAQDGHRLAHGQRSAGDGGGQVLVTGLGAGPGQVHGADRVGRFEVEAVGHQPVRTRG